MKNNSNQPEQIPELIKAKSEARFPFLTDPFTTGEQRYNADQFLRQQGYIAALEEKERDWDKNPYGYLQDSPLWNKTIDQYRAIIEKLQAKISELESSRLKDIEDAWDASFAYQDWDVWWEGRKGIPKPPTKASYLKQFTDKTQL